jgi:predicted nucleic acid-binding Zn ribbon protein
MSDGPDAAGTDRPDPTGDAGGSGTRGSDLAREALAAARKKNAANRTKRIPLTQRSGGSTRALRRRRWSGSGPDAGRDPQPLSATLQKYIKTSAAGADITKATLFARWPEIVGPALADHARPAALTDGELLLQCESTAWASQVRLMAPQIVKKLNEAIGHGSVRRIKAQGPSGPSWRFGPRHVPGRGPRDTYG